MYGAEWKSNSMSKIYHFTDSYQVQVSVKSYYYIWNVVGVEKNMGGVIGSLLYVWIIWSVHAVRAIIISSGCC